MHTLTRTYTHARTPLLGLLVPHQAPPQVVDRGTPDMDGTGEIKYSGRTKTTRERNPEVKPIVESELKTRLLQEGTTSQPNSTVGSYRKKDPVTRGNQTHEPHVKISRLASTKSSNTWRGTIKALNECVKERLKMELRR